MFISICMFFLFNACNHPDLDIQFNKESDIVIHGEGGIIDQHPLQFMADNAWETVWGARMRFIHQ